MPHEASEGLGATLSVAAQLQPGPAANLVEVAQESFVHAMNVAVFVAAGITFLGALIVAKWMPGKTSAADVEMDGATELDLELAALAEETASSLGNGSDNGDGRSSTALTSSTNNAS